MKCLGNGTLIRRRASSIDLITNKKPSYVCNLFGGGVIPNVEEVPLVDLTQEMGEQLSSVDKSSCKSGRSTLTTIVSSFEGDSEEEDEQAGVSYTPPRPQADEARIARRRASKVTSRQLLGCKVRIRDFVKYPSSLEENWWALKVMGVEVLNEKREDVNKLEATPAKKLQTTPILERTPQWKMLGTPSKVVMGITSVLKKGVEGDGET